MAAKFTYIFAKLFLKLEESFSFDINFYIESVSDTISYHRIRTDRRQTSVDGCYKNLGWEGIIIGIK